MDAGTVSGANVLGGVRQGSEERVIPSLVLAHFWPTQGIDNAHNRL